MKRVLVTGARGFIGRHCLGLLKEQGFEVHALSRGGRCESAQGVFWHKTDLLDESAVLGRLGEIVPSHLLHLAWYTKHGNYWTATENAAWLRASLTLTEGFVAFGGRRIVTSGSCAEYDWGPNPLQETTSALQPKTLYGVCKHALQLVQSSYAQQAAVSSAWARVFFPYGPNEPPNKLVSSVICALLRGEPASYSSGAQIRDYVYVKDVAAALVRLLDSTVQGPVNIASGEAVHITDIVDEIARQLGRKDLLRPGTKRQPDGDPAVILADTLRLRQDVGFTPQYDLRTGLAEAIAFWRGELNIS
ncbi:MAG: nucleoside-diphosphate-sugar epimerase [Gammaproteobacteria bacterium]|jgi:nucleoside-diphosphate-sugar epimerase